MLRLFELVPALEELQGGVKAFQRLFKDVEVTETLADLGLSFFEAFDGLQYFGNLYFALELVASEEVGDPQELVDVEVLGQGTDQVVKLFLSEVAIVVLVKIRQEVLNFDFFLVRSYI